MNELSFSIFPNENFLDFRLYQYGWEQCAPLHSFGPFVRNHYLFHYILSGHGQLDAADQSGTIQHYPLGPGQGFLIFPRQITTYSAREDDPWKYTWLEFDGLRAAEYLDQAGLTLNQPIYCPLTPEQGQSVGSTMLYIADHSDESALHLVGHLCLFLDALIRTSSCRRELSGGQLRDFYIQEAVNFMERNYHRDITVEEMARVCGLNRSYFSKVFRDSMGCPPQEFLIRLRLSKAADQLKGTENSIGVIAAQCGYPNQLHFTRAFHQRYGLSPREWRKQNQTKRER